jgi:hypothetical protein
MTERLLGTAVSADVAKQRLQLRPLCVLAGRLVREHAIHFELFELPIRVLVETAYPDVSDTLTLQVIFTPDCQE